MLLRVDLLVEQMDRSVAFYAEHLGARVVEDAIVDSAAGVLGPEEQAIKLRIVMLAFPGGGMIELVQPLDGSRASDNSARSRRRWGLHNLTFQVSNLEQKLKELVRAGVEPVTQPVEIALPKLGRSRIAFIRDPDGNLIEFADGTVAPKTAQHEPRLDNQIDVVAPLPVTAIDHWSFEQGFAEPRRNEPTRIPQAARQGSLPISFYQQNVWLQSRSGAGFVPNLSAAVGLTGAIDPFVLERSLRAVVARHDALRARFEEREDGTVRSIVTNAHSRLRLLDRSDARGAREDELHRLLVSDAAQPFDLSQAPLFRATLVRVADGEHEFLLTMHAIVADGYSLGILMREILSHYRAERCGELEDLPDPPLQFPDVAAWQNAACEGDLIQEQTAFWGNALADAPVLELGADRPPAAKRTVAASSLEFEIPTSLQASLHETCTQHGISLQALLLSAFEALLARRADQDQVVVGIPFANRERPGFDGVVGPLGNITALRTDLSDDPIFSEIIHRVEGAITSARDHDVVPFDRVLAGLAAEGGLKSNPFRVIFAMQSPPEGGMDSPGLAVRPRPVPVTSTRADLELHLYDRTTISGRWVFRTDIFETETIERMSGHYLTLLGAAVHDLTTKLSELPLLDARERRLVLVEWNDTARESPASCLHELFEEQAQRTPDAVAVLFDDESVTYRELDERSNRLAQHLRELGVGPDVPVGVCVERRPEMVVGTLAVLKAGAAYVPLDPTYPSKRLSFMLDNARVAVILTHAATRERVAALTAARGSATMVCFDEDAEAIAAWPGSRPSSGVVPDHLAYVLYTSGSTGRPKGVAMPHRPLANLMHWQFERSHCREGSRTLQFAPFSFDVSCQEMFSTLGSGGTLCLVTEKRRLDPNGLLDFLCEHSVNRLFMPFVALDLLASAALHRNLFPADLHEVITAGEQPQITPALAEFFRRLPSCTLDNQYGPTECHVVSAEMLAGPPDDWPVLPPIGKPIANTRLYVLDERMNPVPIGVAGELYIGGAALARGYLYDPQLTSTKFVTDPYDKRNGTRLYRTGDLAKFLPDGKVQFLGRADHQVKLRGFRVEPGEIETGLLERPDVGQAVVLVRTDPPGDPRLVAYIAPHAGSKIDSGELRRHVAGRLPAYMVPSRFVVLDELPLTATGKIDRRNLPAPAASDTEDTVTFVGAGTSAERLETGQYVAPRDALERKIVEIWQRELGVEKIGVEDNFFDLGGDSIRASISLMELQQALGEVLYITAIFDAPTAAQLAVYLRKHYTDSVSRICAAVDERETRAQVPEGSEEAVGNEQLDRLRRIVEVATPRSEAPRTKNRLAVFVLTPPRSGATLFRVMLGGHPELFSPPELELQSFNSLRERNTACSGRFSYALEGAVRAIMELKSCEAEEAQRIMSDCEERDLTIPEFYRLFQEWIGDRTLVEKSASYGNEPEVLRRLETDFENPLFIHLVRHPCAMIHSYLRMRMDRVFRFEQPFSARQLGELLWVVQNQNISRFLEGVPAERQHRVHFEALVNDPPTVVEGVCRFLGLELQPDMLKPYRDGKRRMTDGLSSVSRMFGDPEFHKHTDIEAGLAKRWIGQIDPDSLAAITRRIAGELGCDFSDPHENCPQPLARQSVSVDAVDEMSDEEVLAQLRGLEDEDSEVRG